MNDFGLVFRSIQTETLMSVSSRADQLLVASGPQWTVLLLLLHGPSPPPRNREYPYFPTATAAKLSQTFFSTPTEAGSLTADMSFVQDHR